ncbi:response regulator [Rhodoferax sp.]|uniref:response regulator n=1 Tax=Rhodoferax sp. TaxID=50421 RepID=UPI0025EA0FEB|nr:response regulator [Rhodoferax sp.]
MNSFLDLFQLYLLPFAIGLAMVGLYMLLRGLGKHDDTLGTASAFVATQPRAVLAAVPVAPTVQAPMVVPEPSGLAHKDLLVVDDSAVARAKLRKLLEGAGYTVALANDGAQALEVLATGSFSVLITDLEMPNMNGFELIAAVQGNMDTEDMPIVAITGHDEMQARVHDCQGLYGIFKKPWNDRELLKRVATLVQMRQKTAA